MADDSRNLNNPSSSSPKIKLKRIEINDDTDGNRTLISTRARDELYHCISEYIHNTTTTSTTCLGKLLLTHGEGQAGTGTIQCLTRKQMRRALISINIQLTDSDESILFESLDYNNTNTTINIHDILIYFYDIVYKQDNLEIMSIIQSILNNNKKLSIKEISRILYKYDTNRIGYINDVTFRKFLTTTLYTTTSTYSNNNNKSSSNSGDKGHNSDLDDILTFFDPLRQGRIDIEYVIAILYICNNNDSNTTNKAAIKIKNMLRILRAKNIDYKSILLSDLSTSPSGTTFSSSSSTNQHR